MNEPKVGVVIVNWNNYEDSSECLESLEKMTYNNVILIVVDNASVDASFDKLKKEFPRALFVGSSHNRGYAGGINQGLQLAMKEGCKYIAGLNNDTVVAPDFLNPLVDFAEKNENAGILGCKIYCTDDPEMIWSLGGHVSLFRAGGIYIGENQLDTGQYDDVIELTLVSGCMMFIRSSVVERVGLLNEAYFFRGEEWEYCWRVKKGGFKMFCIPDSKIWHKENQSHNRFDPKYIYSAYVAKQMFVRQFMPAVFRPVWRAVFFIYTELFAVNKFYEIGKQRGEKVDKEAMRRAVRLAFFDGCHKTHLTEQDLIRCVNKVTEKQRH